MSNLNELSNAALYDGIENRIREVEIELPFIDNVSLSGKFFYLSFRNKTITEKEFAKYIYDKIIRYCIPRKKFQEAMRKIQETGDERYITDLHDQAKNLFVKSLKTHGAQLGEPGELITFIILEAFFNAPQIACKMFLKTSEKMPVHGSDSVHIRMSKIDERLELIWGESKMNSDISAAFDKALESVGNFINGDGIGRAPHDRDIDIIKDMPNVENEKMKQELCDYFDPYSEKSNRWKEIFCCFVGFDYALYTKLQGGSEKEIEEYFKSNYMTRILSAYKLFAEKIKSNSLIELEFILVLLPFKNLQNFREEFMKLLGVEINDLGV